MYSYIFMLSEYAYQQRFSPQASFNSKKENMNSFHIYCCFLFLWIGTTDVIYYLSSNMLSVTYAMTVVWNIYIYI